jgi:seryl-tRNA synthetase
VASGYVGSFPDLIGAVSSFAGSPKEGAEVTRRAETDGDWDSLLAPTEVSLCSASCHNLYPLVAREAVPVEGLLFEVHATCFRHEPSDDPARMQSFRQVEFVFVGTPDDALSHRDRWLARGLELNRALGLDVTEEVANDPFFGRLGQLLAAGQREKALKLEMVTPISSEAAPGAIGSANYHEDHFGEAFELRLTDGSTAHSACVSFGIERTTLSLFLRHGLDTEAWPADVRDLLGLHAPQGAMR